MLFASGPPSKGGKKDEELFKGEQSSGEQRFEDLAGAQRLEVGYPTRETSLLHNFSNYFMAIEQKERQAIEQNWRKFRPFMLALAFAVMGYYTLWLPFACVGYVLTGGRMVSKVRLAIGPRHLNWALGKVSPFLEMLREGVVTPVALFVVYNFHQLVHSMQGALVPGLSLFFSQPYGVGTQARAFMTKAALLAALNKLKESGKKKIMAASLAAGSAEVAILTVVQFLKENPDMEVTWDLVDLNGNNLITAMKMAEEWNVAHVFTPVKMKLQDYLQQKVDNNEKLDLVECVGFMDYSSDEKIRELSYAIRRALVVGGFMVVSMINDLGWEERFILRWLVGWPLLFCRKPLQFMNLLREGGWSWEELRNVNESQTGKRLDPNGAHTVVLAQKERDSILELILLPRVMTTRASLEGMKKLS